MFVILVIHHHHKPSDLTPILLGHNFDGFVTVRADLLACNIYELSRTKIFWSLRNTCAVSL